jgi:hypothetical protein
MVGLTFGWGPGFMVVGVGAGAMRGALLFARTSLTSLALRGAGIVGSAVLLLPATPALADGGAGASNGIISGGAGGSGFAGNPGNPGSDAAAGTDAAGGGGAFFCLKIF